MLTQEVSMVHNEKAIITRIKELSMMLDPPGVHSTFLDSRGNMCDKITIEYNHRTKDETDK